jgi:hemerythrin-like domain-containing protein
MAKKKEYSSKSFQTKDCQAPKEEYVTGVKETPKDVLELLDALVNLYPEHIRKEDTQFFLPSMNYFTQEEQEDMLDRFLEFDKDFTNKRYEKTIEALKERIAQK